MLRPSPGDEVIVRPMTGGAENIPRENPVHWDKRAKVRAVYEWGALVETEGKTGELRVDWSEIFPLEEEGVSPSLNGKHEGPSLNGVHKETPTVSGKEAKDLGYTGDACQRCQSMRVKWNGACQLCLDCGESSGCS